MRVGSAWLPQTVGTGLFAITAINATRPMVSYRAIELGASPTVVGVVAAGYASLAVVASFPIGRRVDRLGARRSIITGTLLLLAVGSSLLWIASIPGLFVAHALLGVGQGLTFLGIQALIATDGDRAGRDGRFGVFTTVTAVGQMVGPAAAGLLADRAGVIAGFALAAGLSMLALVVALSMWRWPPPARVPDRLANEGLRTGMTRLMRQPGMVLAMLASMTVVTCLDMVIVYLPAFGEERGIPVATVGLLLGVRAAAAALIRLALIPLLRLLGRVRLLVGSMLVTAAALALIPVSGATVWALYVLMAVAGSGAGLGQPLTLAWVSRGAPEGAVATALGLRLSVDRSAQVVVPIVVGAIAGVAGIGVLFLVLGAMLAGNATVVAASDARRTL